MRCDAWRRKTVLTLGVAIGALLATTSHETLAQSSDECGNFYRIRAGDTLRGITVKTYRHDRYRELFDANDDIISNPARIEVGQLLYLPCAGSSIQTRTEALAAAGRTPTEQDQVGTRRARNSARNEPQESEARETVSTVEATVAETPSEVASLPKRTTSRARSTGGEITDAPPSQSDNRTAAIGRETAPAQTPSEPSEIPNSLLLLSAKGLEPLAGPDLAQGGLIGALIQASLAEIDRATAVDVAFVNDRQSHLDVLLPMGQFAMSYPWPAPDCEGQAAENSISAELCGSFLFSAPIFQIEMRTFVRSDDPLRQSRTSDDMAGKAICRPGGFAAVDLERIYAASSVVSEDDARSCWKHLEAKRVDAVSLPAPFLNSDPAPDAAVEIEALRTFEPIHAVFHRANPDADELVARLNDGLRKLQQSGAWFDLVSSYLTEFNQPKSIRSTDARTTRTQ